MEKAYEVSFEIAGPTAMWTRSDTGATPISYPVPPMVCRKGLFESISRLKNAVIIPTAVEICAPIVFHDYTTNYGGPLRKDESIRHGNSFQHKATVLINVCYRLYARIEDFKYVPKLSKKPGNLPKSIHAIMGKSASIGGCLEASSTIPLVLDGVNLCRIT